jgi:hypothetical protein
MEPPISPRSALAAGAHRAGSFSNGRRRVPSRDEYAHSSTQAPDPASAGIGGSDNLGDRPGEEA